MRQLMTQGAYSILGPEGIDELDGEQVRLVQILKDAVLGRWELMRAELRFGEDHGGFLQKFSEMLDEVGLGLLLGPPATLYVTAQDREFLQDIEIWNWILWLDQLAVNVVGEGVQLKNLVSEATARRTPNR